MGYDMSQKMTCPACTSHTSSILQAVNDGQPCPHCGLSAAAIIEIESIAERRGDEALKAQLAEALVSADRARTRVAELERINRNVRSALAGEGE